MSDAELAHHFFYHLSELPPRVNVKIEKNSRGYNWEVTILNAPTPDCAIEMLEDAKAKMASLYGEP